MQSKYRSGFTLIEILVSLSIIVIVTALGLPAVKDALQSNSTSRSADVVRGAFETARRMAMHKGLPCGVLIERRDPLQSIRKDDRFSRSYLTDSNASNFSARLSYVQIPSQYPNSTGTGATAYPFYSLLGSQQNNCNREMKFFVKREEAELLYAAALEFARNANGGKGGSRTPATLAARLIKQGTKVEIKLGSETITQFIRTLEVSPNGLTPTEVREFVPTNLVPNASCLPVVADPQLGQVQTGPGVIFTTNESLIPDVSRRRLGAQELAGKIYEPVEISIQLDPIPLAMAPVSLPGRNVIDLSVSGSRENSLLFNTQELLSTLSDQALQQLATPDGAGNRTPVLFHSVVVMFGENGALDSIYVDRWNNTLRGFEWVRLTPPPTLAFLVGPSNAIQDNVDDLANFPSSLGAEGGVYEPSFVPNFVNSDCKWVHLNAQTGVANVSPSASQPTDGFLQQYFNWTKGNQPTNRQLAKQRIERSRRLVYGGAK